MVNDQVRGQREPLVRYERITGIVTITLDRPDKLNALSDSLMLQLRDALERFDGDDEADVAILCGAGRAFSSGADVRQRHLRSRDELERQGAPSAPGTRGYELFQLGTRWKPVIAAIHGYAIGAGLGLALTSDIVIAAAGTQLQVAETPRGLSPIRYWSLLHFHGAGTLASDVCLTGRMFTAEEAHTHGLINSVAPPGAHVDAARELAAKIASNPPLAVRAAVRARRWYLDQWERESRLQADPLKLHLSEDFQESARAFAEKRSPGPFKGC